MKQRSTAKSVITIILIVLLLIACVAAIYAVTQATNASFYVTINGDKITSDVSDYTMSEDMDIKLYGKSSDNAVYVYAKNAEYDFCYEIDGTKYSWAALVDSGVDVTSAFNVAATKNGFSLHATSLSQMLTIAFGETVTVLDELPTGDIFELHILSGIDEIVISFHVNIKVTNLSISPDIFLF